MARLDNASRPTKRLKAYSAALCHAPIKTVEEKDAAADNPTHPSTTAVVEGRETRLCLQLHLSAYYSSWQLGLEDMRVAERRSVYQVPGSRPAPMNSVLSSILVELMTCAVSRWDLDVSPIVNQPSPM